MLKKQLRFPCLLFFNLIFLLLPAFGQQQKGKATYYHQLFWGRKTANGEIYHPYKYTAAHRNFPMGTWLELYFPKTEKKTFVRINDRGPFRKGAILDISMAAAKEIGLIKDGIAMVHIRIIPKAEISDSLMKSWAIRDSISVAEHPKPLKKMKKKARKRKKRSRSRVK